MSGCPVCDGPCGACECGLFALLPADDDDRDILIPKLRLLWQWHLAARGSWVRCPSCATNPRMSFRPPKHSVMPSYGGARHLECRCGRLGVTTEPPAFRYGTVPGREDGMVFVVRGEEVCAGVIDAYDGPSLMILPSDHAASVEHVFEQAFIASVLSS